MMLRSRAIILMTSLLFISCGGGDGGSDTNASAMTATVEVVNTVPVANAGGDQNLSFGKTLLLDATKSFDKEGSIVSYRWMQNGKVVGEEATLSLKNLEEGTYVYTLTVKDEHDASATDSIEVRTYADTVVNLATNQGEIKLKMMSSVAPKAVENFVTHSKNGYYDGVTFHRVIKEFMIQGGDPTGTGRGGESIWGGYFENETSSSVVFDRPFLLAMANRGANSNGSQFFITTVATPHLNGGYTIFGEVVAGEDVVRKIENVSTGRANKPVEDQTISKASLYFELK